MSSRRLRLTSESAVSEHLKDTAAGWILAGTSAQSGRRKRPSALRREGGSLDSRSALPALIPRGRAHGSSHLSFDSVQGGAILPSCDPRTTGPSRNGRLSAGLWAQVGRSSFYGRAASPKVRAVSK